MTPTLVERARKVAAHAAYDTNEGRVARGILHGLLRRHAALGAAIGWHIDEDGQAVAGSPKAQKRKPTPKRRSSGADAPWAGWEVRTFDLISPFQVRVVAGLAARHQVHVRYVQGIAPGEALRVVVSGTAKDVASFDTERLRYGYALEALLDELAAAYVAFLLPGSPNPPPIRTSAEPNPALPPSAGAPHSNSWILHALERERLIREGRKVLPLTELEPFVAQLIRVATQWQKRT